jgi:phosphohistidine swiveling domain-containing protein
MVFGNRGDDSGTGVAFTRDPSTGEKVPYGDYLPNAQGEDVVAGIRNTLPLAELERLDPASYASLRQAMDTLEGHYRDMCDIEFTIEQGKFWLLQTRIGKRTAFGEWAMAHDMLNEGLISADEALLRVDANRLEELFKRRVRSDGAEPIAKGLNASPGAATGKVVFSADEAQEWGGRGEPVILVRRETTPDDYHGMIASQGILTSAGGTNSHAAVVARGEGIPAVCGADAIKIDLDARAFSANGTTVRFTTTLGSVQPVETQTINGLAVATFQAGNLSGVADVRAVSSGPTGTGAATTTNLVQITIGAAAIVVETRSVQGDDGPTASKPGTAANDPFADFSRARWDYFRGKRSLRQHRLRNHSWTSSFRGRTLGSGSLPVQFEPCGPGRLRPRPAQP